MWVCFPLWICLLLIWLFWASLHCEDEWGCLFCWVVALDPKQKTRNFVYTSREDFGLIFYALLGCDSGPHPAQGGTLEWIDCCSMRYSLRGVMSGVLLFEWVCIFCTRCGELICATLGKNLGNFFKSRKVSVLDSCTFFWFVWGRVSGLMVPWCAARAADLNYSQPQI